MQTSKKKKEPWWTLIIIAIQLFRDQQTVQSQVLADYYVITLDIWGESHRWAVSYSLYSNIGTNCRMTASCGSKMNSLSLTLDCTTLLELVLLTSMCPDSGTWLLASARFTVTCTGGTEECLDGPNENNVSLLFSRIKSSILQKFNFESRRKLSDLFLPWTVAGASITNKSFEHPKATEP